MRQCEPISKRRVIKSVKLNSIDRDLCTSKSVLRYDGRNNSFQHEIHIVSRMIAFSSSLFSSCILSLSIYPADDDDHKVI
jgi:hypothetical protein